MRETTVESQHISTTFARIIEHPQSPSLVSPPTIDTPPPATGKHVHPNGGNVHGREREGSEAISADALSKALKEFEEAGRTRERTPGGSPSRKRQRIYGDR